MSFKRDLDKFFPRKEQEECIKFIDSEFKKNPDKKTFLLNLPVGVGKSHLSLMISDWYRNNVNKLAKIDILTNSKILQNQYTDTYPSINDLKGKENYECVQYSSSCSEGIEFSRLNKTKCDFCPYSDARENFITGGVSLTNFYLYILYSLYIPKVLESRGASVLIVDEAHNFDDVMSDFISIKITETLIKKLKFSNEKDLISELKKVKTIPSYISLLETLLEEINSTTNDIDIGLSSEKRNVKSDKRNNVVSKILGSKNKDTKLMSLLAELDRYKSKIEVFLKEYKINPNNWILEPQYNEKTKQNELSLEPIWAYDYLDKYIFSKYDMVFLMSGTILDKNLFCSLNGLDTDKTVYYSIDSPFPLKNRPIYYMPLGKMSFKQKEETFKNYIPYIKKVLSKYSDKKGIIHTNSFELTSWILRDIKEPRLVSHDSSNKDEVLREHISTKKPTVIVSPSMSTGVSLDDDYARFQIVAKVPYPSLASNKNKLRQKMNPDWYAWRTVVEISQMFGRIIRSKEDWGDTIIFDSSFGDVMKYSGHLFPKWITDSVKKVNVKVV